MAITKAQVRKRLQSAKCATEQLVEDVRWLVVNASWGLLGYSNFCDMWLKEQGFEAPPMVKFAAVYAYVEAFGVNTAGPGGHAANGPTHPEIADAIGGYRNNANGGNGSIRSIVAQYLSGVPLGQVTSKKRAQPRRMGKLPNELVNVGWSVYKYQAEAVKEVARKAGVPDSVVVRSALDAYLQGKVGKAS